MVVVGIRPPLTPLLMKEGNGVVNSQWLVNPQSMYISRCNLAFVIIFHDYVPLSLYRLMFLSQSLTLENILSIGLVECNVFLRRPGTFNRCSVRISSIASNNESAADSFIPLNHFSNSKSICRASA